MKAEWQCLLIFNTDAWIELLNKFTAVGPLGGILLSMIEAFIPILPLSVFVAVNIMAFGFWMGYLYSWLGTVIGSFIVFHFIKKFGARLFQQKIQKSKRIYNTFMWIKKHGFFPIFMLLTFPFTPSFLICGLAALAGISYKTFIYSLMTGKLIMIFSLSFIGYNLSEFVNHPIKSITLIGITLSFSLVARILMHFHDKKLAKRNYLLI